MIRSFLKIIRNRRNDRLLRNLEETGFVRMSNLQKQAREILVQVEGAVQDFQSDLRLNAPGESLYRMEKQIMSLISDYCRVCRELEDEMDQTIATLAAAKKRMDK